MQFTQIITILAVAVAGVVAAPGGHGPPPPPPPPPAKPTSVVQQVCIYCCQLVTLILSSNSGFRLVAMATPARSAALQLKPTDIPARVLRFHLSTAMELQFAATTTMV
jgi:hypothetical protein